MSFENKAKSRYYAYKIKKDTLINFKNSTSKNSKGVAQKI